jgi:uncharacterized protein YbjT (DUF2867 family)
MKVLVLGSTGRIGRLVMDELIRQGHLPTGFSRSLGGDVLNPADLDRALHGQEAVIYAIGQSKHNPATLFSDSTRLLLRLMSQHGLRRLVCMTGIGAGDSQGHGGFLYDRIIYPLFTRRLYADKTVQEELIKASDLEWVIVRPVSFRAGPPTGRILAFTDLEGITLRHIHDGDVARFLVDQLTSNQFLRQTPLIGN